MPIYITDDHHVLRIEHKAVRGTDSHELYILEANGQWTPIPLIKTYRPASPGGVIDTFAEIVYAVNTRDWDSVTLPTNPNQPGAVNSRAQNKSYAFKHAPKVDGNNIESLQRCYAEVRGNLDVVAPETPTAPSLEEVEDSPVFQAPTLLDKVLAYAEKEQKRLNRFRWFHHRGKKADDIQAAIGALRLKKKELRDQEEASQPEQCAQLVIETGLYAAVSKHRTERKQETDLKTKSQKKLEMIFPTCSFKR